MTGRVLEILDEVRALASENRALSGKPLGVTGEVAEYHAARLLGLTLTEARTPGHDAMGRIGGRLVKVQIKGRVVLPESKPGQRMGTIKADADADVVVLVLMDETLSATAIWQADMADIRARLAVPGSRARARGALAVSEFRRMAEQVWPHG